MRISAIGRKSLWGVTTTLIKTIKANACRSISRLTIIGILIRKIIHLLISTSRRQTEERKNTHVTAMEENALIAKIPMT